MSSTTSSFALTFATRSVSARTWKGSTPASSESAFTAAWASVSEVGSGVTTSSASCSPPTKRAVVSDARAGADQNHVELVFDLVERRHHPHLALRLRRARAVAYLQETRLAVTGNPLSHIVRDFAD
ncbi:MAG: hypothetical protein Q8L48_06985 [Archangium sp.]|nr:hypothetical protein [Archangium sp.]